MNIGFQGRVPTIVSCRSLRRPRNLIGVDVPSTQELSPFPFAIWLYNHVLHGNNPVRNSVKNKALGRASTSITRVFYMFAAGDNRLARASSACTSRRGINQALHVRFMCLQKWRIY